MKKNNWLKSYLYCFMLAFLFLSICSKNSFLYYMNDWVDANAFFTVGKGMMNGVIPYQQLFEQKGPLLYLIYGIGYLLDHRGFFGVFILEIISFSIFLYYAYKMLRLFLNEKKTYMILPLFTFSILALKSFSHGGSVEEFTLPFFMFSLYQLVGYLKQEEILIARKIVFGVGVIAGCVLWLKYTLLGLWFGWMFSVFCILIYNKQYKEAFINCFVYLLGMLCATIPWLIYFSYHHALDDLWNVYFLINIQIYPESISIFNKIIHTFQLLIHTLFGNLQYFLGIIIGFLVLFINKDFWGKKGANIILLICLMTTGICIYIGGTSYHYYPFILSPFILIGFIAIFSYLPNQFHIPNMLSVTLGLILIYHFSSNTNMIGLSKTNYAQYRFSEVINQKTNASLLNFGFLDGGFYTVSGIIPKYYYFMKNNISYENYPEMMDTQKEYIIEELPDFVIIKNTLSLKNKKVIEEHYERVDQYTQRYQTKIVTYILYQRKNL